jgi:hypothetical protein
MSITANIPPGPAKYGENTQIRSALFIIVPRRNILQLINPQNEYLLYLTINRNECVLRSEVIDDASRGIILFRECKYCSNTWTRKDKQEGQETSDPHVTTTNLFPSQSQVQQRPRWQLWVVWFFCGHSTICKRETLRIQEVGNIDRTFWGSSGSSVGWGHRIFVPSLVNLSLEANISPNSILASLLKSSELKGYQTLRSWTYLGSMTRRPACCSWKDNKSISDSVSSFTISGPSLLAEYLDMMDVWWQEEGAITSWYTNSQRLR